MTSEQYRANRMYYLNNGKCPRCGGKRPVVKGYVLCEVCKKKHDDTYKERREQWRNEGLCIRCGRERAEGRMQCEKCLERDRKESQKYHKEWRDKTKEKGFCISCGATWAEPGHVYCKKCLKKKSRDYSQSEYKDKGNQKRRELRKQRIEAGLCIDCGLPNDGITQRCPKCAEARRDSARKYAIQKRTKKQAEEARRRSRTG